MPVNSEHELYKGRQNQWRRCRDVVGGTDEIKEAGVMYLPMLGGQDSTEYDGYKNRATFYGATNRTVQGLHGAVFRKDYVIEFPNEELLKDVTPDGLSLMEFSRRVLLEILTVSRVGLLVDVAKEGGDRAFVATYKAENVINWETAKIDGTMQLTLVVLQETYVADSESDPFLKKAKIQYRVLRLKVEETTRVYSQEVWRQKSGSDDAYELVEDMSVNPNRAGIPLDYIPFQFINATNLTTKPEKPVLLDLVDVNISHYRTNADLEHGAHFTALPTAWIAGFHTDKEFKIGSSVAWVTSNELAKVGMLEYTGQGLDALRNLLSDKEKQMAVLGARLLEEQKNAVEAEGTQRLRRSGETGALAGIVGTVSSGIDQVLKWMAGWSGLVDSQVDKIEFKLNTDFYDVSMDPTMLTALVAALQGSTISQDTFLYNLKVGEILPPGRTLDQEKDLIENEAGGQENLDALETNITPLKRSLRVNRDGDGRVTSVEED